MAVDIVVACSSMGTVAACTPTVVAVAYTQTGADMGLAVAQTE